MPKIRCLCNQAINLSVIPNRQEFKLIWEPRVEKLIDSLVNVHRQATSTDGGTAFKTPNARDYFDNQLR